MEKWKKNKQVMEAFQMKNVTQVKNVKKWGEAVSVFPNLDD